MMSLGATGFPRKLKAVHRYFSYGLTTSLTGTMSTFQFTCNGMYDPDITGVGHQPVYFDQIGAIYDHYTVFRSRIKITFTPVATYTNDLLINLYVDDDTSTASNIFSSIEQSGASYGTLTPRAIKPLVLSKTWDAKQYFGGDIFDNDNLQGTLSTNPTEQSYYTVQILSIDGNAYAYNSTVEVFYEAVWDELKTIGTS